MFLTRILLQEEEAKASRHAEMVKARHEKRRAADVDAAVLAAQVK